VGRVVEITTSNSGHLYNINLLPLHRAGEAYLHQV